MKRLKVKVQIPDYAGADSQYISKTSVPPLTCLNLKVLNGKKLEKRRWVQSCYHGSWTHQSEKADSQQSGHIASEVEYKQANLHTPVLPIHTAEEPLETETEMFVWEIKTTMSF